MRFSVLLWLVVAAGHAVAQTPVEDPAGLARRGAGVRVGIWNAESRAIAVEDVESPHFEIYFQRGLNKRVALESTVGAWRRISYAVTSTDTVDTRSHVIPLMTALKIMPFTTPAHRIEPYALLGVGFALGLADEAENAIGGGGTSIATGFGWKTGLGIEWRVTDALGIAGSARYQWVYYSQKLGPQQQYSGPGAEGGLVYRFQF